MKKIFYFITISALLLGLVGFIFNLSEYDLFTQLEIASRLPFNNPIDCLRNAIKTIQSIEIQTNISWWEQLLINPFVKTILLAIYNIISAFIQFIWCILNDIWYGLQLVLILLGFNV